MHPVASGPAPHNGHPAAPDTPTSPPPPLEDLVVDLAAQALRSLPAGMVAPPGGCEAAARRGGVEVVVRVRPAASPDEPEQDPAGYLLTLDQCAACVRRQKRSLENYSGRGLPAPRIRGNRGQPSLYAWGDMRPWLEKTFGFRLPVRFPGS